MVNKQLTILVIATILLCLSISLFAENDIVRIQLKDGTVVEGELISFDENIYRIKVDKTIKEIPTNQIGKIAIVPAQEVSPAQPPASPATPAKTTGTTIPTILDSIGQRLISYPDKELTVVWIIDDSPSLEDERERIRNEIDTFMAIPKNKKMLNMAVVGFGKKAIIKCELSRDSKMIKKAIMDVGIDGSGTENCMAAIEYASKRFFSATGKKIFILVTDEAGDDSDRLELVIPQLKKYDITIYILGGEASFILPESKELHENKEKRMEEVSINSGIESAETVIPFEPDYIDTKYSLIVFYLSSGVKYRIKSGFPPYALARLCDQTKGYYYFLKDSTYDPETIKLYKPNLCSKEQYNIQWQNDPLCSIISGIEYNKNRNRSLFLSLNYDVKKYFTIPLEAAESLIEANKVLLNINDSIKQLETAISSASAKKTNKRWMANAELTLAQLYRLSYFLNQYSLTVGEWVKSKEFFNPPLASEYYYITQDADTPARQDITKKDYLGLAQKALERIITNHPGTPWSTVAEEYKKEGLDGYKIYRYKYSGKSSPAERQAPPPKKY